MASRYLKAAREDGAVLMADGFARMTGDMGVATVAKGPGLTNTVTALTTSARARTPVVLLAGNTRADDHWALQRIDQHGVVAPTGAGYVRVTSAQNAVDEVAIAFRRAVLESRPIVLDLPLDVQVRDVEYTPSRIGVGAPGSPRGRRRRSRSSRGDHGIGSTPDRSGRTWCGPIGGTISDSRTGAASRGAGGHDPDGKGPLSR